MKILEFNVNNYYREHEYAGFIITKFVKHNSTLEKIVLCQVRT